MMWFQLCFRSLAIYALLGSVFLIGGCAAYAPKIVLDQNGVANQRTSTSSSINVFNTQFQSLYERTLPISRSDSLVESSVATKPASIVDTNPKPSAEELRQLTRNGASLAYQFCSSFFKRAGTEQQYLLFSRDVIGVLGTLATGVLGATRGSPAATAWVGIGSGAALSGISIYSRNFLFSEDNVQSVQDLTLKAMTAQTDASLQRAALNQNYALLDSVQDIMDIQSVCEVQKILSLVKQSIGQAQPQAVESANGQITTNVLQQDPARPSPPPSKVVGVGVAMTPAAVLLRQYLYAVDFPEREQRLVAIENAAKALGAIVEADSFVRDSRTETVPIQDAVAKRLGLSR